MAILLPALGVAFAAFCVWLAVRIINRRERWAMWTLATLAVLSVYAWLCQQVPPPPAFIFGGLN
jgi:hypothetical protein